MKINIHYSYFCMYYTYLFIVHFKLQKIYYRRDNYRRDYADAVDFGPDQALGGAAAASTSGPAYVTPIYAPANTAAASRNGEQQQPPPDLGMLDIILDASVDLRPVLVRIIMFLNND